MSKVLVIDRLQKPTTLEYEDTLEFMYNHIECKWVEHLSIDNIDLWFDEEGKLNEKRKTFPTIVFLKNGNVIDYIVGKVMITSHKREYTIGYNDSEIISVVELLNSKYDIETGAYIWQL